AGFMNKNGVFGACYIVFPKGEGLQDNTMLWRFISNRCSIRTVSCRPSFLRRRPADDERTRRDNHHLWAIRAVAKYAASLCRSRVICFQLNDTKSRRSNDERWEQQRKNPGSHSFSVAR